MKQNWSDHNPKPTRSRCDCCGRFVASPEPDARAIFERKVEEQVQTDREQRLKNRADYLHHIPPDKRSMALPEHEERRYQLYASLEKMTPEQHSTLFELTADELELHAFLRSQMKRPALPI